MGVLCKVVDLILFLTFLSVSVVTPVMDAQLFLPQSMFPNAFISLFKWYTTITQDYLLMEKPYFFTALIKLEVFFLLPLALLNIYGMLTSKPWFNTTCIIFGTSLFTCATAMLGELIVSEKSSDKLVMLYSPFWGSGVLALLRGLLSQNGKASATIGNGPAALGSKKIA
ncbi:hypothetical protein DITRI_Ditri12bG0020400 [Diplodiscus trichospermus]